MKPIPDELKNKLWACRRNINPDEDVPDDLLKMMTLYVDRINDYLKRFDLPEVNNQSETNNDIVQQMEQLSLDTSITKIKVDQLPTFDGKFSNWKAYKGMIENLLINNIALNEELKKSMLLKTMTNEPARIVSILIGQQMSLPDIWNKVCEKFDDHQKAILEIKNELNLIPRIDNENQTLNLKKAKDIVESADLAVKGLDLDTSFYTANLVQAVANKFYYRAKRKMLVKVKKFEDLVKFIDELYEDAVRYDYNKVELNDSSSRRKEDFSRNASSAAIDTKFCNICGNSHQSTFSCFDNKDPKFIADVIRLKGLCLKCLRRGHRSKDCSVFLENKCKKCDYYHATEMHDVLNELYHTKPKEIARNDIPPSSESSSSSSISGSVAALSFFQPKMNVFDINRIGKFENRPTIYGKCNGKESVILLDSGSNISLIDEDLILEDIQGNDKKCSIVTYSPLGGMKTAHKKIALKIKSHRLEIIVDLFPVKMNDKNLIIIGTDNLSYFYESQPEFLEIPSIFGKIRYKVGRDIPNVCSAIKNSISNGGHDDVEDLEPLEMEPSSLSNENLRKLEQDNDLNLDIDDDVNDDIQIVRKEDGRFEARLPFLSDLRPKCNFYSALSVLDKLLKRLNSMGMKKEYENQLMSYVNNNQAEENDEATGYFLPHHAVFRESSSTPIRVVFNGSFGLEALNKLLWKGVAHGLDIFDHMIRFRKGKFAFTADLSKAFLQILIHTEDRKFLKFLWKNDKNELKMYQMKVLPFGLVSSPAILTSVTKKLLCDQNLNQIADAIYMDDIIWAMDSESDLCLLINNLKNCFQNAGFVMHKICSNSKLISSNIENDSNNVGDKKVLGIVWNTNTDELSNVFPVISQIITKRDLLSMIGRFFDPYGYLDPWKLKLRSWYREVLSKDWDDRLPEHIINGTLSHLDCMEELKKLKMIRNLDNDGDIHGFADASTLAYGYSIYVKKDDKFYFLLGKAKLAPPKDLTIVELELKAIHELNSNLFKTYRISSLNSKDFEFADQVEDFENK
uniref:Uncharacterized protein LOC113798658 n=1 Tax=Dermatophagoides pteronyssinus TaxID=6956 RepID=A0A6P6YIH6_DERPT|nr:uncharacterized protein LOC113798658 [Dermatophagoides pteronyssinus]